MLLLVQGKIALKAALVAAPLLAAAGYALPQRDAANRDAVAVVHVPAARFAHRLAGDFARDGRPVNAPVREVAVGAFAMMATQVSAADYELCVADSACARRATKDAARDDRPVTGVSHQDAIAYAAWFSRRTGQSWRLPTEAEWAHAAGSRFADDAVAADDGADAFTRRWLAKYEQESLRAPTESKAAQPFGHFGLNERGIADLAGNVWEWTDSCFVRQPVDGAGELTGTPTVNCGVRVVAGAHRAYVTDFIRDARAGGCAVGVPPANLGFRLVRDEETMVARVVTRLRRAIGA
ncbi:formylglycine-generating enzyme family protein [Alsobacter sp. R-9]